MDPAEASSPPISPASADSDQDVQRLSAIATLRTEECAIEVNENARLRTEIEALRGENQELQQRVRELEFQQERNAILLTAEQEKTRLEKEKVQLEKEKVQVEKEKVQVEKEKAQVEKEKVQVEKEKVQLEKEKAQFAKQRCDYLEKLIGEPSTKRSQQSMGRGPVPTTGIGEGPTDVGEGPMKKKQRMDDTGDGPSTSSQEQDII